MQMRKHAPTRSRTAAHKWRRTGRRNGTSPCVFTSPVLLVNYACRGSLPERWSGLGGSAHAHTHTRRHPITPIHSKSHFTASSGIVTTRAQRYAHQSRAHVLEDNLTTHLKITQTRSLLPFLPLRLTHARVAPHLPLTPRLTQRAPK